MAKTLSTEDQVKNFYDTQGWSADEQGNSVDAQLWEDLRPCANAYIRACRLKILKHLPAKGERILDAASGPIQYPEYLEYSKNFKKRYCVDISQAALDQAKKRLGNHGEYFQASLLDLPFASDFFDASLSLHTIYHIARENQVRAVQELLRVTKPGVPLVVIYANPNRPTLALKNLLRGNKPFVEPIYYFAHPLQWWKQFQKEAEVKIYPWRSLTAPMSKRMIPGGKLGESIFSQILHWEETYPGFSNWFGAYPMIVLKKKTSES